MGNEKIPQFHSSSRSHAGNDWDLSIALQGSPPGFAANRKGIPGKNTPLSPFFRGSFTFGGTPSRQGHPTSDRDRPAQRYQLRFFLDDQFRHPACGRGKGPLVEGLGPLIVQAKPKGPTPNSRGSSQAFGRQFAASQTNPNKALGRRAERLRPGPWHRPRLAVGALVTEAPEDARHHTRISPWRSEPPNNLSFAKRTWACLFLLVAF